MARSFSHEARSDSHKIGETRYRMSHLPSTTAIARTLLLAGILLAVAVLAARTFLPAHAQELDKIDFDENSTGSVAVYTATDPEGEDIVWSLLDEGITGVVNVVDYPDHALFSIDGGALTFKSPPDYEDPKDEFPESPDVRNVYKVMVLAIAGDEGDTTTAMQPVQVTVKNLDEPGTLTLSTAHPKIGVAITATLTDPDGKRGSALPLEAADTDLTEETDKTEGIDSTEADTKWRWATSTSDGTTWNDIPGATSNTYTPNAKDEGVLLRVTAIYKDGHGVDDPFTSEVNELEHSLPVAFENVVLPLDYTNKAPKFPDQDADAPGVQTGQRREVREDAQAGHDLTPAIAAIDPDRDGNQETLVYTLEQPEGTVQGEDFDFVINRHTGLISVGNSAELDFETTPRYEVVVRATDPGNLSATSSVVIKILDVNEAPLLEDAVPANNENREVRQLNEIHSATGDPDTYDRFISSYEATDEDDELTSLSWRLTGSDPGDFDLYSTNDCLAECRRGEERFRWSGRGQARR